MDATETISRENLLIALQQTSGAKSTAQIATELGCNWRAVITFRSFAGVKPAFRGPGGQAFFAPEDVAKIKEAAAKHGPLTFKQVPQDIPELPRSPEQSAAAEEFNALCNKAGRMAIGDYS